MINPIDFVSSFPAHLPYAALREVGLRLAGPRGGHDESRAAGHRLGLFIVVGPQVVPYLMCKGHRRLRAACGDLQWHLFVRDISTDCDDSATVTGGYKWWKTSVDTRSHPVRYC